MNILRHIIEVVSALQAQVIAGYQTPLELQAQPDYSVLARAMAGFLLVDFQALIVLW